MADESDVPVASEGSAGKWILLALAVIYVAGSLCSSRSARTSRQDEQGPGDQQHTDC